MRISISCCCDFTLRMDREKQAHFIFTFTSPLCTVWYHGPGCLGFLCLSHSFTFTVWTSTPTDLQRYQEPAREAILPPPPPGTKWRHSPPGGLNFSLNSEKPAIRSASIKRAEMTVGPTGRGAEVEG